MAHILLQLKALHERQAELLELQRQADGSEQTDNLPPSDTTTPNNTLNKVSNISAAARSGRDLAPQSGRGYDEDKDEDENEADDGDEDDEVTGCFNFKTDLLFMFIFFWVRIQEPKHICIRSCSVKPADLYV